MVKAGWRAETMGRWPCGGPLTLEKYRSFFVDPWSARLTNDQLNQIITMHGFVKLQPNKNKITRTLVGLDLQPPRRSTLRSVARTSAAASIVGAQAAADVDAIGWTECPIGSVAVFAGYGEDPPEQLEPMPPPADHVLALVVRRARSKRTRASAYPRRAASEKAEVKEEVMEEADICQSPPSPPPMRMCSPTPPPSPPPLWMCSPTPPPPSPPPLWMRSPTPPPPPPSPPQPQTVVSPPPPSSPCSVQPPPGFRSPPPPGFRSPPPPGFGSPPPPGFGSPPPPCWSRPTLAPLPAPPPGFGPPQVTPPPPQLYWGLPLPMEPPPSGPGAPPTFTYHGQPAGPPPLWRPTVQPSYPAPCWGAPSVLPPQQAPWRWPHPPPRWAPPHMLQQQRPPPPWGCMEPSAPPPMPPQQQPHFEGQQPPQPPEVLWGRPRPVF